MTGIIDIMKHQLQIGFKRMIKHCEGIKFMRDALYICVCVFLYVYEMVSTRFYSM